MTRESHLVCEALGKLGIECSSDGPPSSPPKFEITEEVIAELKRRIGKKYKVEADGSIAAG